MSAPERRPARDVCRPRVVRDAPPDAPGEPRLLDALLRRGASEPAPSSSPTGRATSSGTTSSSRAAPTGRCRTSARCSGSRRTPSGARSPTRSRCAVARARPAALEDFAEVVTGLTARVDRGLAGDGSGRSARGHPPPPRVAPARAAGAHALSGRAPPSSARGRASRRRGATSPRAATAVVWPWRVRDATSPPKQRRSRSRGASRCTRSAPRHRSTWSRGPGSASRRRAAGADRRRARRARARDLSRAAGPRPGRSVAYGTNWTVRTRTRSRPARPGRPCSELTRDGTAVPWSAPALRRAAAGRAAPGPPAADEAVVDIARGPRRARHEPRRARCARPGTGRCPARSARWPATATPILRPASSWSA